MTSFLVTAGVSAPAAAVGTLGRGAVSGIAGVIGLLVGSFLNVVIYRVPRALSVVEPRSFCPHCDTPLRSFDNIPVVSWVVLRGRCRRCRGPISIRYPLVELATGVVFAAVGWGFGPHWAVAGFCVLAATLIALVAVERDRLPPPLTVSVIGTAIAAVVLVAAGIADHRSGRVVGVLVGVAVAAVVAAGAGNLGPGPTPRPWIAASPVLLPVGAALGWLGPAYVGEGLATSLVILVVDRLARRGRPKSSPTRAPELYGLAFTAGVAVATIVAVAVGTGAGV